MQLQAYNVNAHHHVMSLSWIVNKSFALPWFAYSMQEYNSSMSQDLQLHAVRCLCLERKQHHLRPQCRWPSWNGSPFLFSQSAFSAYWLVHKSFFVWTISNINSSLGVAVSNSPCLQHLQPGIVGAAKRCISHLWKSFLTPLIAIVIISLTWYIIDRPFFRTISKHFLRFSNFFIFVCSLFGDGKQHQHRRGSCCTPLRLAVSMIGVLEEWLIILAVLWSAVLPYWVSVFQTFITCTSHRSIIPRADRIRSSRAQCVLAGKFTRYW